MNIKQIIALYTLIRRELKRISRISAQVFLLPIITTTLYFLIFGNLIGAHIGDIEGTSYPMFIAPGLMMISVILSSFGNVSVSLYGVRFHKNIEEILISPTHPILLLLGYTLAGVFRGLIVACLIFILSSCFLAIEISRLPMTLLIVLLVSFVFSLAGFTNAMFSNNFEKVMIIPTFVLTPLTYLSGVFYSIKMLPTVWQKISWYNPIFYMVNALREAMIGYQSEVSFSLAIAIIFFMILLFILLNLILLKKGTGLRE